jgi:hypothetical protein
MQRQPLSPISLNRRRPSRTICATPSSQCFNGGGEVVDDRRDNGEAGQPGAPLAATPASTDRRTAEEYYAAGEFGQCAQRLRSVVAAGHAERLRLLAACSFFAGDNERALSAATALEALQPHSAEALYWIDSSQRTACGSIPCAIPGTGIGLRQKPCSSRRHLPPA